jgi:hypothetical protein
MPYAPDGAKGTSMNDEWLISIWNPCNKEDND